MRQATPILFLTLTLLLAGCYQQPGAGTQLPPEIERFVLDIGRLAHSRDVDGLLRQLPQPVAAEARLEIERLLMTIPTEPPQAVAIIAFVDQPGSTAVSLGYEFERTTTVLQLVVGDAGGRQALLGIHEAQVPTRLAEIGGVTWRGKGWLHYTVLAVAIANPILIVTALVVCVRTSGLRRRWLWIAGILFGVGRFTVNWHTGDWEFQALYLLLFGAGAAAQPALPPMYYPFLLTVALPVGAVWFLASRGMTGAAGAAAPQPVSDSAAQS